jgi:hypothetical protein
MTQRNDTPDLVIEMSEWEWILSGIQDTLSRLEEWAAFLTQEGASEQETDNLNTAIEGLHQAVDACNYAIDGELAASLLEAVE